MKPFNWKHRLLSNFNATKTWFWITVWTLLVLGVAGSVSITYWGWLTDGESGSTTMRNVVLAVVALVALPLAIWRSVVAEKQVYTTQRQYETARLGLLNERYQRAADMLGSKVLSVRLGGIYALQRLGEEYPDQYQSLMVELFCAFARHPTVETHGKPNSLNSNAEEQSNMGGGDSGEERIRPDVQAVMTGIGKLNSRIEQKNRSRINLRGAILPFANLAGADLSNANVTEVNLHCANLKGANLSGVYADSATVLSYSNLVGAKLTDADLSYADLSVANLRNADLCGVKLIHARLEKAELSGADMTRADLSDSFIAGAKLTNTNLSNIDLSYGINGLTQAQLNAAHADPDNTPNLGILLDAETLKRLVWRGPQNFE